MRVEWPSTAATNQHQLQAEAMQQADRFGMGYLSHMLAERRSERPYAGRYRRRQGHVLDRVEGKLVKLSLDAEPMGSSVEDGRSWEVTACGARGAIPPNGMAEERTCWLIVHPA